MYRPGQILVSEDANNSNRGRTKKLDATNLSSAWASADTILPRVDHNLVLLPNGKVLVVGGRPAGAEAQIWDPAMNAWSAPLAAEPAKRNYHSTAVLLPSGQVISAGGSCPAPCVVPDSADIYCPPYLFKPNSDLLAARPVISCQPGPLAWGKTYTIQVTDTTGIRGACLMRPGATTHAFDQNQRYVPLTFVKAASPPRLFVTVRANPDSAPAGNYMLFLTGSPDAPEVPSIAKWVKLGSPPTFDVCDTIAPATNSDFWLLSKIRAEFGITARSSPRDCGAARSAEGS